MTLPVAISLEIITFCEHGIRLASHHQTTTMLSILRKARLKDKEMRILMLYEHFFFIPFQELTLIVVLTMQGKQRL